VEKKAVIIEINRVCNYKCVFCNVPNNIGEKKDISLELFKERIEKYDHVGISGGEPLLHKSLKDMILLCKNKASIVLATNLSFFPEWLVNEELDCIKERFYVQVNLPTVDNELYKNITGTKINVDVILRNIDKLMQKKRNIVINVVVTKLNSSLSHLLAITNTFSEMIKKNKLEKENFFLLRFHPIIAMNKSHRELIDKKVFSIFDEYMKKVKMLYDFPISFVDRFHIEKLLKGKTNTDYITLEGNVYPSLFHAWID